MILSDRDQLRKCWALSLLPEEAFAAALADQPDSKSPAAAQRLHRLPGGGGRARGCPMCGHLYPNWRRSAGKQISPVPWVG